MAEIAQIPDSIVPDAGKNIRYVAWWSREDPGPVDKKMMEIATDDGQVYFWSRFRDSEPWTWDARVNCDGTRDTLRHTLPSAVETLVERTDWTVYK